MALLIYQDRYHGDTWDPALDLDEDKLGILQAFRESGGSVNRETVHTELQWRLHRENELRWPEIAPHSCSFCQTIVLDIGQAVKEKSYQSKMLEQPDPNNPSVYVSDLLVGAALGCVLFRTLALRQTMLAEILRLIKDPSDQSELQGLIFDVSWWEDENEKYSKELLRGHDRISWTVSGLSPSDRDQFHLPYDGPSIEFHLCPNFHSMEAGKYGDKGDTELAQFGLYEVPNAYYISSSSRSENRHGNDQHTSSNIPTLPPNLVPASELSFSRVKSWLSECQDSHTSCRAALQRYTPKRLLEISHDNGTFMLRSRASIDQYIALSYCWGGDQPSKTTKASLRAETQPRMIKTLPATIQDAIRVVQGLGFRYLWIDSMCIVQDDFDDVSEQLAEMHKIFRGAYMTILATSADRAADGFLHAKVEYRPYILAASKDSGHTDVILSPLQKRGVDEVSLFTRAWCFQEMYLSTRHIAYNHRNMVFSCLEAEYEDGGYCLRSGNVVPCRPGCKDLTGLLQSHPSAWQQLVDQYNRLKLSNWTDKLPAVSALAEEYAQRFDCTDYYAGLWSRDFFWQLLWIRVGGDVSRRTKEYCGPTWSWCSLSDADIFTPYEESPNSRITAVLIDVRTELLCNINPYGQITSGRLELRVKTRALNREQYMQSLRKLEDAKDAEDAEYPDRFWNGLMDQLENERSQFSERPNATSPDTTFRENLDAARAVTYPADPSITGGSCLDAPGQGLDDRAALGANDIHYVMFDEHLDWPEPLTGSLLTIEIGCTSEQDLEPRAHGLVLRGISNERMSRTYERVGRITSTLSWFNHESTVEEEVVIV